MKATNNSESAWKNRIVGYAEVPVSELVANPRNWRKHPKAQRAALTGSLSTLGWIDAVKVNRTTGHMFDGHARMEEAIKLGDDTPVPVIYVEMSEEEERIALVSLDPMSALAETDEARLTALLTDLYVEDVALSEMIANLLQIETSNALEPSESFREYDTDIETQYRCPSCHYEWSGRPK